MNAYHWGLTLVKIVFFDKHYCLQYIPYSGRFAHQNLNLICNFCYWNFGRQPLNTN